jgi:cytochrome c556
MPEPYRPRLSTLAAILLLCLCAFIPLATVAHEGATGIVKERMMAMEGVGKAMKEIKAMLRGQVAYDGQSLAVLARRIRDQSGSSLTRLFPEHSLRHPSKASPEVWRRWELFETLARDLGSSAEALAVAAEQSDGQAPPSSVPGQSSELQAMTSADDAGSPAVDLPMAEFAGLARSCAACHREFRIKD